ncbi:MAG: hypothetical protein HY816_19885 [Candidatus Wallbacteria bacterium]|nr:hypothetical protein [Candidatus Wallbacteria bacterium]
MRRALAWLVLVVVAIAGSWYAWVYRPWQARYELALMAPDAGEVEPGARVRVNALTVGKVDRIEPGGVGGLKCILAIGESHRIDPRSRVILRGGEVWIWQAPIPQAVLPAGSVLSLAPEEPSGLARTIRDLQAAAAAAREASQAAARLLTAPEIAGALADLRAATSGAAHVTVQAEALTGELRCVAAEVRQIARAYGPTGTMGRDLSATASRIASASADVAAVTGRVRAVAEDPGLHAVLDGVAREARATAEVIARGRRTLSKLRVGGTSTLLLNASDQSIYSDLVIQGRYEDRLFAYAGWEGGPGGGITFQAGRRLNDALKLRTGTLRGEIGAGLDVGVGDGWLSFDAYRLPRPVLRATLRWPIADDVGIVLRGDDLTRGRRAALVGFEKRF